MGSAVTRTPPATPQSSEVYFARNLAHETDCWDVHHAISNGRCDFVLLDVRSELLFTQGHIPEAICKPYSKLTLTSVAEFAPDTLFVVYCNGPHCNGADKAALKLSSLGRYVKKMIGGITGWQQEGFNLVIE